jgi:hypothetical protein
MQQYIRSFVCLSGCFVYLSGYNSFVCWNALSVCYNDFTVRQNALFVRLSECLGCLPARMPSLSVGLLWMLCPSVRMFCLSKGFACLSVCKTSQPEYCICLWEAKAVLTLAPWTLWPKIRSIPISQGAKASIVYRPFCKFQRSNICKCKCGTTNTFLVHNEIALRAMAKTRL